MNPRERAADAVASRLRTFWPLLVGHLAALGAAWAARLTGIEVESFAAYEMTALLLSWLVYEAGRWLERRPAPWQAGIGRWLLSVGMDFGPPVYPKAETRRPRHAADDGQVE